jgi:thiamine-phosphate pyrophosphorylase
VGPVFGTSSKAAPDPVVGLEFVSWARARTNRPIVAIGGLSAGNVFDVVRSGAFGVAVISELMKATTPEAAAAGLVAEIRRSSRELKSSAP